MSSPLLSLGNWASPSLMLVLREGRTTASVSSSASSKDPADFTAPASVTNSPSICSRARCTPIDAAAPIAYSKDEAGPRPPVPRSRRVQEEHGAVPPALLLPAPHELPITRRGTPVHSAQLVAIPVGPRHHVVFSGRRGGAGAGVTVAKPRPGERCARQGGDRRRHHEGDRRGRPAPHPFQPQRVRHPGI